MNEKEKKPSRLSWFWKWFLNNQVVTALLIILLCLIIVLVFTKVSYLFEPIWQFLGIVGLPVVLAGIFYYLMNPVVDFLENRGVPRLVGIIGLFILVIGLIIWGIVVIVPQIQEQTQSFIENFPQYVDVISNKAEEIFGMPIFEQFQGELEQIGDNIMNSLGDLIKNISSNVVQSVGSLVGKITSIVVAILTMPFILFYLLKDGRQIVPYFVKFLPTKARKPTREILSEVNGQVSSYIRGQLTVAFAVALMFVVGFSIVGLDYAVTLGIVAGILNLIPYLGSFLAMIPSIFLALVAGPVMLIKVLIVFAIEQTIEGRVVSPLVLGSQLAIHPVTILVVLLTSGKLFGLVGVVLGVPVYAAIKVVITHAFKWYTEVSGLYEEEVVEMPEDDERDR